MPEDPHKGLAGLDSTGKGVRSGGGKKIAEMKSPERDPLLNRDIFEFHKGKTAFLRTEDDLPRVNA